MKIRLGFVSNSSSSSFTCDICGHTESGWDMCLSDAEMVESRHGMYCEEHLLKPLDEPLDEDGDEYTERDKIPDELCPIYNLALLSDTDILLYMLKDCGQTEEDIKDRSIH